jgi:hypothetical protein
MKTMKIFFALSLAMILFAVNSNNVNADNNKTKGIIKYQVILHVDANFNLPDQMIVFISDENGRYIDHPQLFVKGTTVYGFMEKGPQTGIRIAQAATLDGTQLDVKPDVQKGTFEGGKIYTFNVYLRSPDPTGTAGIVE